MAQTAFMERLLSKIDRDGPIARHHPELGKCWIWTGGCNPAGYGKFWVNDLKQSIGAHVVAYVIWVGDIPPGLVLDHFACSRRRCVNPLHVTPVQPRVNAGRNSWKAKERCPLGHSYDAANTYVTPRGFRACRQCRRDRDLVARQANPEPYRTRAREWNRRRRERERLAVGG